MSELPLEGWVPIRLFWQGGEPLVEWCYLGRERFTHPFFDSTIQLALQSPVQQSVPASYDDGYARGMVADGAPACGPRDLSFTCLGAGPR